MAYADSMSPGARAVFCLSVYQRKGGTWVHRWTPTRTLRQFDALNWASDEHVRLAPNLAKRGDFVVRSYVWNGVKWEFFA